MGLGTPGILTVVCGVVHSRDSHGILMVVCGVGHAKLAAFAHVQNLRIRGHRALELGANEHAKGRGSEPLVFSYVRTCSAPRLRKPNFGCEPRELPW